MAEFNAKSFCFSDKVEKSKIAILGGRSFLSSKGKECYMLDILTSREVTTRFVDREIFETVETYGCGIYRASADFNGYITDIEFIDNF